MDYQTIEQISENQITSLIESIGGERISKDDSREESLNADYILLDSIIELKLIEEEGLEKLQRQKNIARLFDTVRNENTEVCVIDPELLSDENKQKYFNILSGPIKSSAKKAAKQLESSRLKINSNADRVLFLINNGYSALSHDEFKKISTKCVRNDTSKIDYLVCAGMYYHSDKFESFVLAPIDIIPIQKMSNPQWYNKLSKGWGGTVTSVMNKYVKYPDRSKQHKLPVLDIEFSVNNITYLKPAPPLGSSSFWSKRPRINSSGIDTCPCVAITFPKISKKSWNLLKNNTQDEWSFKDSFMEWNRIIEEQQSDESELQIFLPIVVSDNQVINLIEKNEYLFYKTLADLANDSFHSIIDKMYDSSRRKEKLKTVLPSYIYVLTEELGMDKKNDLSSIYIVRTEGGTQNVIPIFEQRRLFLEHAMMLGAAYAIRNNISMVLYDTDIKYSWSR